MFKIGNVVSVSWKGKPAIQGVVTTMRGAFEVCVKFEGADLIEANKYRNETFDPPDCLVVHKSYVTFVRDSL